MTPAGLLLLPILLSLFGGDMLTEHECWTPFRGIGAWRNEQVARKSLRLLHAVAYRAAEPEMCE